MNILALIGSPRKGSNTDLLVDQVLMGAQSKGHTRSKIYLYDLEILPCLDCRACKKGDFHCALKDDMQKVYPELEDSDCIIFGTPVYWYGPTGKMKLFLDRLRPFIASKKLEGKRGAVVVPSAEGAQASGPLIEMFRMSFEYIGIKYLGAIIAIAYERKEIENDKDALKKAYDFGIKL
jgi:multimeric flavodoxin WrbA